jgi:hypothetical protein
LVQVLGGWPFSSAVGARRVRSIGGSATQEEKGVVGTEGPPGSYIPSRSAPRVSAASEELCLIYPISQLSASIFAFDLATDLYQRKENLQWWEARIKLAHLEFEKRFGFQAIPGTRTRLCCSSCGAAESASENLSSADCNPEFRHELITD